MKSIRMCLLTGAMVIIAGKVVAMEAMQNNELAEATGQDGISIILVLPDLDGAGVGTDIGISANSVIWHDKTGFTGATSAGAIQLGTGAIGDKFQIINPANTLTTIDIDAVGDIDSIPATSDSMLNIKIAIPSTVLKTGHVYVGESNGLSSAVTNLTKIMDSMTISIGASTINIQLGAEAQGSMFTTNTTSIGGINITPWVLYDVNSGGALQISNINIVNSGGVNLDLKTSWDVSATGLVIMVDQFGSALAGADIKMTDLKFGSAATPTIGHVEFIGLNLAGTSMRIAGKL